jgi:pimeloyl-ACP methyl ester carboxylesterase
MKLTTTLFLCIPLVNNVAASRRWHHESNIKTETLVPSRHPLPSRKRQLQDGNSTNETQPSRQWWEFGLTDSVLDEVALYYLGQSWHQSADVADVLETIGRLNNSDAWSWTMEWRKTAQRMQRLAQESLDGDHNLTASQAYLRASTYYRASLHRHPDPFHPEVPEVAQQAVDSFSQFLELSDYPCSPVRIPYQDGETLPGYLCITSSTNVSPTIIFNEGKDGWAMDGKFVVDDAIQRGYNVLLWDGPGMGQTIRLQGLPFRHDWENVLTPVIDYLETIPQVDSSNLALISVSLGGFLGPRATVFEHRLKAQIANAGVVNWYRVYELVLNEIDSALLPLLETDPDAFDAQVEQIMSSSDFLHWGLIDSMWHHGVNKPSELIRELQLYNIEGMVQNITTATLVIDAEAEERGQSLELYEALPDSTPKAYVKFTAEEAAQFHVQPGATAILSMRMFNWLDDVLDDSSEGPRVGDNAGATSGSSTNVVWSSWAFVGAAIIACCSIMWS